MAKTAATMGSELFGTFFGFATAFGFGFRLGFGLSGGIVDASEMFSKVSCNQSIRKKSD